MSTIKPMRIKEYIAILRKGISGFTQPALLRKLCENTLFDKATKAPVYIPDGHLDSWLKKRGETDSALQAYFQDENFSFDGEKFLFFLKTKTQTKWDTVLKPKFEEAKTRHLVNCDTTERDIFLDSVVAQFKEIVGVQDCYDDTVETAPIPAEQPPDTNKKAPASNTAETKTNPNTNIITLSRPLQPSDYFRGRDKKLVEIKGKLLGAAKLLLLNGMGGIGKTEMCRKIFHEALNNKLPEVKNIGWITYNGSLEQTFFHQFPHIESPANKPFDYLQQAEKHLNAYGGSLLLFVDNANEMSEKEAAWLLKLECKVLLTSRKSSVERLQSIEIGKLEREDCRILYRQHLNRQPFDKTSDSIYGIDYTEDDSFHEDLDAIITMADRHTLAIELLAKTQKASMLSYGDFRKILDDKGFSLDSISESIVYTHNPEQSDNWDRAEQVFIEQFSKVLDISGIQGEKLRIMRLFSALAPEPAVANDVREWLDITDFENINRLISGGWLTDGTIGPDTPGLAMHPLISSVVRYKALPDECIAKPLMTGLKKSLELTDKEVFTGKLQAARHATSVIDTISSTGSDYVNLIAHASNMLLQMTNYQKAEEMLCKTLSFLDDSQEIAGTIHNNLGRAYELSCKYDLALAEYTKARDIFLDTVGHYHRNTATAYSNMANVHATFSRHSKALELQKTALKINAKVFDSDDPVTRLTCNNMAVIYITLGDYNKARALLNRNLTIVEMTLDPGHPHIAVAHANIAEMLEKECDYDGALHHLKKAHDIFKQTFGSDAPELAGNYNGLGTVYLSKGAYKQALDCYQKGHTIFVKIFGEEHPDTAMTLDNIGQVHLLLGNYHHALEMAEKSFDIIKSVYGEKHLSTAKAFCNLASVHDSIGNYSTAISMDVMAMEIRKNILGAYHPDIASIYNSLSITYNRTGQYPAAIDASHEALNILEKTVGLKHAFAASSYNNIGHAHMHLGNFEDADKSYKLALRINKKVLGEEHPNTASDYDSLGSVQSQLGHYPQALKLHYRSKDIMEKILGTAHPKTSTCYSNIGGVYERLGAYEEAKTWYKKALKIRQRVFGKSHASTAFTLNSLAGILSCQGQHVNALDAYKDVLNIYENIWGPNHPDIAKVCNNIAFAHDSLNNRGRARHWYEKTLEIKKRTLSVNHLSTAISYSNLAAFHFDGEDFEQAEDYYQKALAIREERLGEDHPDTAHIYHALACIYSKCNKLKDALVLFSKAYHTRCTKLGPHHSLAVDTYGCIQTLFDNLRSNAASFETLLQGRSSEA